jgi:phosphopantothenoylcysteine decarboxylase/phosphopantothenate--cysteine ligase
MLTNKTVVLGITGGIAAYKGADLASKLTQAGAEVKVIMTEAATKFVTPLTLRSLTNRPVVTDMFELTSEFSIEHVALAEAAADCGVDAILVGTSFMMAGHFPTAVREIKARADLPVIIFPGSYTQITSDADAILYTSLISGRNPQYLIDEQVDRFRFYEENDRVEIMQPHLLTEPQCYYLHLDKEVR